VALRYLNSPRYFGMLADAPRRYSVAIRRRSVVRHPAGWSIARGTAVAVAAIAAVAEQWRKTPDSKASSGVRWGCCPNGMTHRWLFAVALQAQSENSRSVLGFSGLRFGKGRIPSALALSSWGPSASVGAPAAQQTPLRRLEVCASWASQARHSHWWKNRFPHVAWFHRLRSVFRLSAMTLKQAHFRQRHPASALVAPSGRCGSPFLRDRRCPHDRHFLCEAAPFL